MGLLQGFRDTKLNEKIKAVIEEQKDDFVQGEAGENCLLLNEQFYKNLDWTALSITGSLTSLLENDYFASKNHVIDDFDENYDRTLLAYEDNEHFFIIAQYDKANDAWVLSEDLARAGITTADLPVMDGKATREYQGKEQETPQHESMSFNEEER